ncbi:phosphatidylethanolamine N-methyltransferase [Amanita muscaria]
MTGSQSSLRQRKSTPKAVLSSTSNSRAGNGTPTHAPSQHEEVVWGKTPGGEVFRVPTTHDVLTTLFHPRYPKSHLDLLNLGSLALQVILFLSLPRNTSRVFFFFYFAFWRAAYDAGLGYVLTKQSKKKWIVKEVQRLAWLDEDRCPRVRNWIRDQLAGKMGKDYSFDDLPLEYNTWLLFRQVVDLILVNDFLSYCLFAFSCFRIPTDLSSGVHIMRWLGGLALIGFNLWVKTEAHNVVKDYGWYWGDVFFQRGNLVFDGVFELAPHPMYSVGYAGYYGLSLISGSYAVLFVSLAAHAAQFAFLVLFENPHIERMYGQRRLIAKRVPVVSPKPSRPTNEEKIATAEPDAHEVPMPPMTDGETATDTDTELETETETEMEMHTIARSASRSTYRSESPNDSTRSPSSIGSNSGRRLPRRKALSQHDLLNKYFRRDTVILKNVDLLRANDAMLVMIILYGLGTALTPRLSENAALVAHVIHTFAWLMIHYLGLGLLLKAQSENKCLVRHFVKHYHYSQNDGGEGAICEAFNNWKVIYNLTLCMTYVSCIGLASKSYMYPSDWKVGNELLRHTVGVVSCSVLLIHNWNITSFFQLLMGLHIWATMESFEVLGVFGWFFGDFFMEDFPAHLEYTGIYRYLNNPEAMGGAAWFGLALISGSKLVFALAVMRHLLNWWFLSYVENPHMRKLYGDSLRKDAGFVKVIKSVASKNARILESRADKHAPELKRVVREVKGTFERVYEETADVVEDFIARSRPKISEVMQDTKVLLQQSREKLVITRIANDLSCYDTAKYKVTITPNGSSGNLRFHLGEPISVKWQAPQNHSRKDWIGLYRIGANKSTAVTKISSLGMWLPVHDEEWDGDIPLGMERLDGPLGDSDGGILTFKGDKLPWLTGQYEVRYHHDGKYNVLSIDGPIEIYVDKPDKLDFASVRSALLRIVPLCLDSDPSLIPISCKPQGVCNGEDAEYRDPDDFAFWTEGQAKRICIAIQQVFDVEYAPEVVVADANLTALAKRIITVSRLLYSITYCKSESVLRHGLRPGK